MCATSDGSGGGPEERDTAGWSMASAAGSSAGAGGEGRAPKQGFQDHLEQTEPGFTPGPWFDLTTELHLAKKLRRGAARR